MKTKLNSWINLAVFTLLMVSCEDIISPTLEQASPVFSVDAWLTNKPGTQVIILSKSQAYFDNTIPPGVSGATVVVSDDKGKVHAFQEDDKKPGYYLWSPKGNEVFGTVGARYQLNIQINGDILTASSRMGRVPPIDSIVFQTDKRTGSADSVTRGEFWATDPKGVGDAYWIRTYKNGVLLNKPSEINVAYDASFSAGGETDGVNFITPIRRGINSRDTDENDQPLSPIVSGDSLNVQIYSLTVAAFDHLNQVKIQTDRPGGFQELFSTPLANVTTNITNAKLNGSKAVGFFNVSAVSTSGKRYKK